MKSKLFLIYFRLRPILKAIAILSLVATFYNQFLNHRLKFANTDSWIVTDVISGDRFMVDRGDKKLEIQLCGIHAKSDKSRKYLRSLIAQGDGSVVLDRVRKQDGLTVAEVFVQLKPDYQQEIHLNTEMVTEGVATIFNYQTCPSAEYLARAAAIVDQ